MDQILALKDRYEDEQQKQRNEIKKRLQQKFERKEKTIEQEI